ncbi:hypothetical protein P7C70_g8342, partial [Phenoliferia sp. Uapishka_3]
MLKSFDANYTTLRDWPDAAAKPWIREELIRLWNLRVAGGGVRPRPTAQEKTELKKQANKLAMNRWFQLAQDIGAADWMDQGEVDQDSVAAQPKRRDGACALVKFVARCPNLKSITLPNLDFGRPHLPGLEVGQEKEVDYHQLVARIPTSSTTATSIESVHFYENDWRTNRIFLNRAPNVQQIIYEYLPYKDPLLNSVPISAPLKHLRQLNLGNILLIDLQVATAIVSLCSFTLRHLTFIIREVEVESRVATFLANLTLDYLSISAARWISIEGNSTGRRSPHLSLSSYLSSSQLRHLRIPFVVSQSLLQHLPTSLQSLHAPFPAAKRSLPQIPPQAHDYLKQTVDAIIAAKKSHLPTLDTFSLNKVPFKSAVMTPGDLWKLSRTSEEVSEEVERARQEGVSLVLNHA